MIATCLFLLTSVFLNHMWYTSALGVTAQKDLISFETVAHFRELEHHFFPKNDSGMNVCVLLVETLETYVHYDFVC